MAQCKEGKRRDMSIFQAFQTRQGAILGKSLQDAGLLLSLPDTHLERQPAFPTRVSTRLVRHSRTSMVQLIGPVLKLLAEMPG